MSISDVNPYIVTMPPVQGYLMDKFMRLSGQKDKRQGDSRSQARDDADHASSNDAGRIDNLEEELKNVENAIPVLVEDIATSVANRVYNQRLEITDPEDPSDVPDDPLREERKAVKDSKARASRRNETEEVRSDLYRERRDGPRQRYNPPSRPNYPGTPWEN